MLSYLHAFHAGNFADIQKHSALVLALRMMQAKASAIACFDTHAGSASYDLTGDRALKTGEANSGVQKIWRNRAELQSDDWKAIIDELATGAGPHGEIGRYPGSPHWFRSYLREQDSLTAFELHPAENQTLAQWGAGLPGVRVCREDGLNGLLRCLPPRQPRLLVLTDPSYEVKSEYEGVADTLTRAWQKCRHGVYLIWYPVLAGRPHERLLKAISGGPVRKVLRNEIILDQPPERGMSGSGMLVVNPPWGFDRRLAAMMEAVSTIEGLGITSMVDWLVPE
ncbi:23S rRNA (adenine(2030)-N(6))-methyltransferase RlmJ [Marinobacter sp. ATCH36]|uniref:23S rRNA (adenine(2030)-N(6))-methyltransferase RlmJ n=1 Tax=Marinobacter sp. ATCH36 TaxID=2945106 RepID=UPI00201FC0FC|nr:23S rRNA (adenine(2030)-N(6))-methyltransferase RlmJ [Marinobacter sp. ATCH36]MCL7943855.1 23S rRNA (adenine(2030)-N(6))-methyltransferase RlmJ [Marinobacter sp. ATCH36]